VTSRRSSRICWMLSLTFKFPGKRKSSNMPKLVKYGPRYATPSYTVKPRGEHGCTVTGAIEHVLSQVACYLESRPDGIIDVFYSEHCAKCGGSGRYCANRRTLNWKPCKVCNGQPELRSETLIEAYDRLGARSVRFAIDSRHATAPSSSL
jgi:hypothetical protein